MWTCALAVAGCAGLRHAAPTDAALARGAYMSQLARDGDATCFRPVEGDRCALYLSPEFCGERHGSCAPVPCSYHC